MSSTIWRLIRKTKRRAVILILTASVVRFDVSGLKMNPRFSSLVICVGMFYDPSEIGDFNFTIICIDWPTLCLGVKSNTFGTYRKMCLWMQTRWLFLLLYLWYGIYVVVRLHSRCWTYFLMYTNLYRYMHFWNLNVKISVAWWWWSPHISKNRYPAFTSRVINSVRIKFDSQLRNVIQNLLFQKIIELINIIVSLELKIY